MNNDMVLEWVSEAMTKVGHALGDAIGEDANLRAIVWSAVRGAVDEAVAKERAEIVALCADFRDSWERAAAASAVRWHYDPHARAQSRAYEEMRQKVLARGEVMDSVLDSNAEKEKAD